MTETTTVREMKLQQHMETIKKFAEWCEREEYAAGHPKAAAHFASIAMGVESTLEEVTEQRECEKTGRLPSYCI